jgi:hypothetical protein
MNAVINMALKEIAYRKNRIQKKLNEQKEDHDYLTGQDIAYKSMETLLEDLKMVIFSELNKMEQTEKKFEVIRD